MYVDNVLSVVFRASCYTSTDIDCQKVVLLVKLSDSFLCWRYKIFKIHLGTYIKSVFVIYKDNLSDQTNPLCKMITQEERS